MALEAGLDFSKTVRYTEEDLNLKVYEVHCYDGTGKVEM